MTTKTTLRVFGKHKFYSAINILGLSTGFALCMVIFLILSYDYNHDRLLPAADRTYKLNAKYVTPDKSELYAITSRFLGPKLTEEIPEVEAYGRFSRTRRRIVKVDENYFFEHELLYSDQESIRLFEPKFLLGSANRALTKANELVLTASKAIQWFGSVTQAHNASIFVDGKPFQVVGIIEDLAPNLHLQFKGLLSHKTLDNQFERHSAANYLEELWAAEYFTYVRFAENTIHHEVQAKSQNFLEEKVYPLIRQRGIEEEDLVLDFVPVTDSHFETESAYNMPTGDKDFFKITLIIGAIILIIISINYANLSMALLSTRTKELGMKKVLGATKSQITTQLIFESVLYVIISLLLAYGLTYLIIDSRVLESIINRPLTYNALLQPITFLVSLILAITLAVLSSFYPALKYAKVKLHEVAYAKKQSNMLRSLLITVQFMASLLVITSMLMMKLQLNLVNSQSIGITEDPMLIVDMTDNRMASQAEEIKQKLSTLSSVARITDVKLSSAKHLIGSYSINMEVQQNTGDFKEQIVQSAFVSNNFSNTFDISLVEGRDFSADILSDTSKVLVNQSFVQHMSWDTAIGKKVIHRGRQYEVVGVIKDFYFKSLKQKIEPLILYKKAVFSGSSQNLTRTSFHIVVVPGLENRAASEIEEVFQSFYPEIPFEFTAMEDRIGNMYMDDRKESQLIAILGYIAVLIAILGLVGLSSFEVNQRMKEISIRKVLGASPSTLFINLSLKQIKLIVIAGIIATPLCYLFISNWLNEYVYRIELSTNLILAALISLIAVSILGVVAISAKIIEAGRANPAQTLRTD
ncbi:ABC transporter permease [Roseivirga pacifica]